MRPPKRPLSPAPSLANAGGEQSPSPRRGEGRACPERSRRGEGLEAVLSSIRTRPSFGPEIELEALELGGYAVVLTRFRRPVIAVLKDWSQSVPGFWFEPPPSAEGLYSVRVKHGSGSYEVYANGAQAYMAAPASSVRALLAHPHDFIPEDLGPRAAALRVHLAGGSDQWVSPSQLARFLASGRDGALSGIDWGQLLG